MVVACNGGNVLFYEAGEKRRVCTDDEFEFCQYQNGWLFTEVLRTREEEGRR